MTDYSKYIISDTTTSGTDYSKYILDEDEEKKSFFGGIGLPDFPDVRLKKGLPFGIPRPEPQPIPRLTGPQPAQALTTRVAAPTPPRDTAIRAPDKGEWEEGPFKPMEIRAAEPDVQRAVGTGLWKAINKVVRPGKDPVGNYIKGGIRFAMGIADFPSELTHMASDILVHSKGPIEALEMTSEKIDEMVTGLAKPLENLLWLVGHQASPVETEKLPEEYKRRLDEHATDPSAPLVSIIIGKGIAHGIKNAATKGRLAKKVTEITDYVKARRAGLPPADVAKVTFPEPTPTVEGAMPKKIVVGKEALALKRKLKAEGVTEKPPFKDWAEQKGYEWPIKQSHPEYARLVEEYRTQFPKAPRPKEEPSPPPVSPKAGKAEGVEKMTASEYEYWRHHDAKGRPLESDNLNSYVSYEEYLQRAGKKPTAPVSPRPEGKAIVRGTPTLSDIDIPDPRWLKKSVVEAMTKGYREGNPTIFGRPIAVRKTTAGFEIIEGAHRAVAAKAAGVEPPIVVLTEKQVSGLNAPQVDALARKVYAQRKAKPGVKQPWEMTREGYLKSEFENFKNKYRGSQFKEQGTPISQLALEKNKTYEPFEPNLTPIEKQNINSIIIEKKTKQQFRYNAKQLEHKQAVQKAILDKKLVPEPVLAEYPELKTKPSEPAIGRAAPNRATEQTVNERVKQAPSYQKLFAAFERFNKRLHGKDDPYTLERIERAKSDPDVLLGAHAGVMNAKSQVARTLSDLADAVFKETGLPRKPSGKFRGENTIDWVKAKAEYPELGKKGPGEPTLLYSGIPVPEMVKEISRLTNDIIQKAKGPPEIRVGVKQAKQAMIEHDRQIRDGEWIHRVMKKGFGDAVPEPSRQMEIIHAVQQKRNPKYYNQLTPQEKGIVHWMELELDKLEAFNREHKITDIAKLPEGVRYVPGSWKNPKTGEPYPMMYGKFSKGLPQAKQKKFATYEQGMETGAKMATTNLGDIIGGAWESLTRAHQARAMFKTLHQIGAEKDMTIQLMPGKSPKPMRMVERWDLLNKQGLTDGYTRFSHHSLDRAITFRDTKGTLVKIQGAVGVRKELFPFVKAYIENPSYGTFSQLNFATKSLKLGLSAFHIMSLGMQEAANWRVPFVNIPRGLKAIKNLNPDLRILHREGLDLFKGYEDVGYRNRFFEGSNQWGKMGNIVTKPIEGMRSFIFDVVQPGMKASFALDQYQKLLPKYLKKGLTKEQCARAVVKAADGHFSHEHWKRSLLETNRFMVKMYFMPEARRAWQNALLSPTWQREHMLIAKDVVKSFMPDKLIKKLGLAEMGPIKAEYRKYALGGTMLIGMAYLYNRMATKIMDGKAQHLWDNPSVFSVRALWDRPAYTVEAKDGTIRTIKGGPAYFRPFKSIYEVAEWVADPPKKFIYKVSPFMAGIGHQMWPGKYQKDYKGWKDIPERAWDFVTDVATPISWAHVAGYLQGKKEWPDVALPFFGMPTSKLSGTAFKDFYYGQLIDIEKKHGKNNEWYRLRRSFDFDPATYKKYKENP